jgi:hypothetical protein
MFLSCEKNQWFLLTFGAQCWNLFLDFSQHVMFLSLSSMNHSKTLQMPCLSDFEKRQQGIFQNQSVRGFFGFESPLSNLQVYE